MTRPQQRADMKVSMGRNSRGSLSSVIVPILCLALIVFVALSEKQKNNNEYDFSVAIHHHFFRGSEPENNALQEQEKHEQQQQQNRDLCACTYVHGDFYCPGCRHRGSSNYDTRPRLNNRDYPVVVTEHEDELVVEIQHEEESSVEQVVVVVPTFEEEEEEEVEVPEIEQEVVNEPQEVYYPSEDERDYFKTAWPELVGMPGHKARQIILSENPALAEVWLVPLDLEGQMTFTADYRPDRVTVTVDDTVDLIVLETPVVG